jgi:hypothetical protein
MAFNYYPRWSLLLTVPVMGTAAEKRAQGDTTETVTFAAPVLRFRLERNDHTQADTLEVMVDERNAGTDPRFLSDATCVFSIGDAGGSGDWTPKASDVRFAGILRKATLSGDSESGLSVSMLFHDYTSMFLAEKPFVTAGVPKYSMTLSQAWSVICDHVGPTDDDGKTLSVVSALRDSIVFEGEAKDVVLGKAVSARFAKLGYVPVKPQTDAWAVWQQCVGMLGLISFIRLDKCVVTTATDYYTEKNPPRLIWGNNVDALSYDRDAKRSGQGIIITSFDPLTGSTLESFYPPVGDDRVKRKHLSAKKAKSEDSVRAAEARIAFAVPGITDQSALDDVAKRVYEERSRQELEGRIHTHRMSVDAVDTTAFDLLTLGAGEVVRIEVARDDLEFLGSLGSDEARVNYLVGRGYDPGVADLISKNMRDFSKLPPNFFTKRVHVSADADSQTFDVEIVFCNKIQIDGSASASST